MSSGPAVSTLNCQTETVKCEKFGVRLYPKIKKSDEDKHLRLVHVHDHPKASFKEEVLLRLLRETIKGSALACLLLPLQKKHVSLEGVTRKLVFTA